MAEETHSLPASSWDEVKKLVQGYARLGENVDRDALSKLIGIHPNTISGNNKFLTATGIISGGNKKSISDMGRKLGRAIEHGREEQLLQALKGLVSSSEFLSNVVSTVRIKGGMERDDLQSHILYASGLKNTKPNRTGAATLVDLLVEGQFIEERDGKLHVAGSSTNGVKDVDSGEKDGTEEETPPAGKGTVTGTISPTIAINIQLQIPETENATVYENLFKALRLHLLEPTDDEE